MELCNTEIVFDPKISIIVAVYNQEKQLYKCLDSILNQTYKNIEIIVVNDGSTDNSRRICEEFIRHDARIKLINQNNGGVGKARNTGLKSISGEYVTFVDADDYIDNDLISNYIFFLKKYRKYILISGFRRIESNRIKYIYKDEFSVLNLQESLKILFEDNSYRNYLWNKLYPSKFFDKVSFDEAKTYEDIRIQYKLFELSQYIVTCPFVGYNYIYHKTSITNTKQNIIDAIDAHVERLIYIYGKGYNCLPILSQQLFWIYMANCNFFSLRNKILYTKKKSLDNKIINIKYVLCKNLPKIKFFVLCMSLKNSIVIDFFVYVLWCLNKIRKFIKSCLN